MTVVVVHYSLLCATDCDFVVYFTISVYVSYFRGVRHTAVQLPTLREIRLFSLSEAPDAVSRVHVDP